MPESVVTVWNGRHPALAAATIPCCSHVARDGYIAFLPCTFAWITGFGGKSPQAQMRWEHLEIGRKFTCADPVVPITSLGQGPLAALISRRASRLAVAWALVKIVRPPILRIRG